MESSNSPDALLVRRLASHDETALHELIDAYGRYVYGKALQLLGHAQLAEEIAQETLLVLWWEPRRFDESKGSLRAFLLGMGHSKAIDVVRRRPRVYSNESLISESVSFFESRGAVREDDGSLVRTAISSLPLSKQQVVFLVWCKGLTYREAARVLGVREGTVKNRIRDSLLKLSDLVVVPERG